MDNTIAIVNMRSFFNREIFMHAIGDVRFKKPIALKQAMYTMIFLIIYTLPIVTFVGFHMNIWYVAAVAIPPFLLGNYANKPIWGGRTLIDFFKVTFSYIQEPRGWTDHRPNNELGKAIYSVDQDYWVSRRRELKLLAGLKEEIKTGNKTEHRILYENDNGDIIDIIDMLPKNHKIGAIQQKNNTNGKKNNRKAKKEKKIRDKNRNSNNKNKSPNRKSRINANKMSQPA